MSIFIIAEIGPNHNGDINIALKMTDRLAAAGVNSVKFQISRPEHLHSLDSMKAKYQKEGANLGDAMTMSKKLNLSRAEHKRLAEHCRQLGVEYMCTAFDLDSLRFLNEEIGVTRFKVASGELFSIDTLEYISKETKPIILSTGMASDADITSALDILQFYGNPPITLLHCVSNYPAPMKDVNMLRMIGLSETFGLPVGFSDHTIGNDAAIVSAALGARIIEKHVTLDKSMPGPDHKASATIEEFEQLVKSIRNVELCLGSKDRVFTEDEIEIAKVARKSIILLRDMDAGEVIQANDIAFRRPGTGISPIEKNNIIGKKLSNPVMANRVLQRKDIVW